MQNFEPAGAGVPHDGQRRSSARPHSMQNFAFGGFCAWQWAHAFTSGLSRSRRLGASVRCITCDRRWRAD
ncbi:MAG: hypothetical protein QOE17_2316 [Gaiellales bacterium]|nr:hypothetical protein [Gaiellales bacterium]